WSSSRPGLASAPMSSRQRWTMRSTSSAWRRRPRRRWARSRSSWTTRGSRAHACAAKKDDAVDIERVAKAAEAAMGKIDILVNNAGITRDNISMRMKDEEWEKVLQVNLTGTFRLTRAAMRGMMRRRFGRVINITSIVGVTGNPGQANYAAAKAGLIGLSKSLAQELASRAITVNCVAPGFIATPMTDVLTDEQK